MSAEAKVPRNFKLLDELDEAEKSSKGGADVSLGLARADDTFMSDWSASIFAQAGGGEPRMWFLQLHADADYPNKAPTVRFTSKVNMDCVDAKGNVVIAKVPYLASWNPKKTLLGAVQDIKGLLMRAPRSQPPDGVNY
jgi:ubiquitin-conjugating enzyme E2 variant